MKGDPIYTLNRGTGVPILLMHGGLGLDHTYFRPWLEPLEDIARLTYYDHRGNGRSVTPPDDVLSHDVWIADAERLRESMGHEQIFVLGHSYGGYLAQEYAARYPERVAGLILIATAPVVNYADVILANAERRGTATQYAALLGALSAPTRDDLALADLWRTIAPLYFSQSDADIDRVLAHVQFRARPFNTGMFQGLPTFDMTQSLGAVTAPVLIISGDDDFINPVNHAAIAFARLLPKATLEIIPGTGHFPFVEAQDHCLTVMRRWLHTFFHASP